MNHLRKIAAALAQKNLDALLISGESNEFYATGFHGEGLVLITPDKNYYTTDSRYIEAARHIEDAEIQMVDRSHSHLSLLKEHLASLSIKRLGFEDDTMTVSFYQRFLEILPKGTEPVAASSLLRQLRSTKDAEEIACMKAAQAITDRTFSEILNDIRPGRTEKEIAARLTYLQMTFGAEGNSFDPIAASGANGSMPHAVPSLKPLAENEFLTMDFGCFYQGYCSDMTRTVCLGSATDEMVRVYETVLSAQKAGIACVQADVAGSTVHEAAASVIDSAGYGAFFGHSFGHSLGIDIHEAPTASPGNHEMIPENAVISAEPGIYLPGRFGVRIEDVTIYRKDGAEDITHSPKELICL